MTIAFRLAAAAALALGSLLALTPRPAAAQIELTGRWTGIFEFITLGKQAGIGPASVFDKSMRGVEGEPAKIGEGTIDVRIRNRVGDLFFGRWVVNDRSAEFVCTMRDEQDFVCGGRKTNAVGTVYGDETLRMCWTSSGENATAGCADLRRPS